MTSPERWSVTARFAVVMLLIAVCSGAQIAAAAQPSGTYAGAKTAIGYGDAANVTYTVSSPAPYATAARNHVDVRHTQSYLSLQALMDHIHGDLPTYDHQHYKGSFGPTSAWLTPDSGGFGTSCSPLATYVFRMFEIYTNGVGYKECLGFHPIPPVSPSQWRSRPGEFQAALNGIGDEVLGSVGTHVYQATKSVYLSRRKGTFTYECLTSTTGSSGAAVLSGIREVVLQAAHRGREQYLIAAVHECG
jgi:hypothetical protein